MASLRDRVNARLRRMGVSDDQGGGRTETPDKPVSVQDRAVARLRRMGVAEPGRTPPDAA